MVLLIVSGYVFGLLAATGLINKGLSELIAKINFENDYFKFIYKTKL